MKITKENIKVELLKRIPELRKYKLFKIEVENKEIKFRISSFTSRPFTTEVDIESKSIDQLLDELAPKVQNLMTQVEQRMKVGK